jgi:hypothetical protein
MEIDLASLSDDAFVEHMDTLSSLDGIPHEQVGRFMLLIGGGGQLKNKDAIIGHMIKSDQEYVDDAIRLDQRFEDLPPEKQAMLNNNWQIDGDLDNLPAPGEDRGFAIAASVARDAMAGAPGDVNYGPITQRFERYGIVITGESVFSADATPLTRVIAAGAGRNEYRFCVPREVVSECPEIGKFDTTHRLGHHADTLFRVFAEITSLPTVILGLPLDFGDSVPVSGYEPGINDAKGQKNKKKALIPTKWTCGEKPIPHAVFMIEVVFRAPNGDLSTVHVPRSGIPSSGHQFDCNEVTLDQIPDHSDVIAYSFVIKQLNPVWNFYKAVHSFLNLLEVAYQSTIMRTPIGGNAQDAALSRRMTTIAKQTEIGGRPRISRYSFSVAIDNYSRYLGITDAQAIDEISNSFDHMMPANQPHNVNIVDTILSIKSDLKMRAFAAYKKHSPEETGSSPSDMSPDNVREMLRNGVWLPQAHEIFYNIMKPEFANVRVLGRACSVLNTYNVLPEQLSYSTYPLMSDPDRDSESYRTRLDKMRRTITGIDSNASSGSKSFNQTNSVQARRRFNLMAFEEENVAPAAQWESKIAAQRTIINEINIDIERMDRESRHLRKILACLYKRWSTVLEGYTEAWMYESIKLFTTTDEFDMQARTAIAIEEVNECLLQDTLDRALRYDFEEYVADLLTRFANGDFDKIEKLIDERKIELKAANAVLNQIYEEKRVWSVGKLEEMAARMRNREHGAEGPFQYVQHWDKIKAAATEHAYGLPGFENGVNVQPLLTSEQSYFQSYIQSLMVMIDKFTGRVNSHLAILKAQFITTHLAVLQPGEERAAIYFDGPPGSGKTDIQRQFFQMICISFHSTAHMTEKSITTEEVNAMTLRVFSEVGDFLAGTGPKGPDPVLKEILTAGEGGVDQYARPEQTNRRTTESLLAMHYVSYLIAGNTPFEAFKKEMRDRYWCIYVSSVLRHPEADTSHLKNDTALRDAEQCDAFIKMMKDENFWAAMFMLKDSMHIGDTRWNMTVVNRILNDFDDGLKTTTGESLLHGRVRKMVVRVIKHWSVAHAVQWHLNGPGGLITHKYDKVPSLSWLLEMEEMAHNPSEEIIIFAVTLCMDNILDTRLGSIVSKILPACRQPSPADMNNLTVSNKGGANPDERDPIYKTSSVNCDYNYQEIPMKYTDVVSYVVAHCSADYAAEEVLHVLRPSSFLPNTAATGNGLSCTPIHSNIYVPKYGPDGRPETTVNANTGEVEQVYITLPPVTTDSKDRKTYVLTRLNKDPYENVLEQALANISNAYTQDRPYRIALGRSYVDKSTGATFPNALKTFTLRKGTRVPIVHNPYAVCERTFMVAYQGNATKFFNDSKRVSATWKSRFSENQNSPSEEIAMVYHAQRHLSPAAFEECGLLFVWRYQLRLMKMLRTCTDYGDAHLIAASYLECEFPRVDGLPDISAWAVKDILHMRKEFDIARRGAKLTDPSTRAQLEWNSFLERENSERIDEVARKRMTMAKGRLSVLNSHADQDTSDHEHRQQQQHEIETPLLFGGDDDARAIEIAVAKEAAIKMRVEYDQEQKRRAMESSIGKKRHHHGALHRVINSRAEISTKNEKPLPRMPSVINFNVASVLLEARSARLASAAAAASSSRNPPPAPHRPAAPSVLPHPHQPLHRPRHHYRARTEEEEQAPSVEETDYDGLL